MRSFQIKYDSPGIFEWQLKHIKSECELIGRDDPLFYLSWRGNSRDGLDEITDCIKKHFPKSVYYGNESSGNIINGELTYSVAITCYVFEEEDTRAELVWVEEGTEYATLGDLWDYCNGREGLRAVELLPTISCINILNIENNIPTVPQEVALFGGASVAFDSSLVDAEIIANRHPATNRGMVAILYYGSNLHISYDYVLGWKGLGRYMKVTKSHDKVIEELDGIPAFEIYEKYLGIKDNDKDNLVFPLIVEEDGIEYIRTPQSFLPDKSMRMFANIEEGLMARIAYGDKNTILSSLFEKVSGIADFRPQVLKTYSCVARRLFWGDNEVYRETKPLQEIAPISGYYSGGEILRFGDRLKVLNSTLVVVGFREGNGDSVGPVKVTGIEEADKSLISRITHFVKVVSDEQIEQQQLLQEALTMADTANRSKTEFLFNMSHDIRTPMNAILGFTNMAIRHVDDTGKTEDCLHKIKQSGDLLLQLINSVLEVSRIESGKAVLSEQAADIYSSFDEIESTMQVMAESKDIRLTFEFGEITDRYVFCDYGRCSRVFVNIITNGIKYTHEGGFVRVICEQIESEREGYGVYRYTFEDNGIGMSEEFQKHVFEQFSREHNSTTTGIQGTGLGMAVCKSFVDLMGGSIECSSHPEAGTRFTVILPFRIRREEKQEDAGTGEEPKGGRKMRSALLLKGKRVLLVEDNELNREIAVGILEEEGLKVEMAENGKIAVDMVAAKKPSYYDSILMDIQMPVMNGYEATRAIRQMYPKNRIPIIALSANAFAEDREASVAAGMDDHVSKPIVVEELMKCLRNHLTGRKSR